MPPEKPDTTAGRYDVKAAAPKVTAERPVATRKLLKPQGAYAEPRALRIERTNFPDLVVPLYPDRTYTFGRSLECTIVFASDEVSRNHGQLTFSETDRWVYRDLNSTYGTFLVQRGADGAASLSPVSDRVMAAGDVVRLSNGGGLIHFTTERRAEERPKGAEPISEVSRALEQRIRECAKHNLPVFLLGPSGTGKTYVARKIHDQSGRAGRFVLINCGRLRRTRRS